MEGVYHIYACARVEKRSARAIMSVERPMKPYELLDVLTRPGELVETLEQATCAAWRARIAACSNPAAAASAGYVTTQMAY